MPTHRPAAFFPCALFALSITLLAAGSAAQTTHVVDAKGGPGSNYLDIQAAVDAASPGDRIVVRAGAYLVFQVTKPLSISAEAGVQVGSGIDPNRAEVIVRGIGAGQTFSMHGVDLVVSWKTFPVVVDQCLGTVILEGANVLFPGGTAGVLATDCRDLRVVRLRIDQVRLERSNAVLEACTIGNTLTGVSGLQAIDAYAHVVGSRVTGTRQYFNQADSAAVLLRSDLISTRSEFLAGPGGLTPLSAVRGTGRLRTDTGSVFAPANGGVAIDPQIDARFFPHARLTATGAPQGSTVTVRLDGVAGERYALFVGYPAPPQAIPGLGGKLGIQPVGLWMAGALDSTGSASTSVPVPPASQLDITGLAIAWQAATAPSTNPNAVALSNPSCYVHGLR